MKIEEFIKIYDEIPKVNKAITEAIPEDVPVGVVVVAMTELLSKIIPISAKGKATELANEVCRKIKNTAVAADKNNGNEKDSSNN